MIGLARECPIMNLGILLRKHHDGLIKLGTHEAVSPLTNSTVILSYYQRRAEFLAGTTIDALVI